MRFVHSWAVYCNLCVSLVSVGSCARAKLNECNICVIFCICIHAGDFGLAREFGDTGEFARKFGDTDCNICAIYFVYIFMQVTLGLRANSAILEK